MTRLDMFNIISHQETYGMVGYVIVLSVIGVLTLLLAGISLITGDFKRFWPFLIASTGSLLIAFMAYALI